MLKAYLDSVRNSTITQRSAQEFFKVKRRTINNKLKGRHFNRPRKPDVLSSEGEEMFVKCILLTSDLGFPTDNFNLQHFIKDYLEAKAKSVKQFQNNLLRRDWMNSFLKGARN